MIIDLTDLQCRSLQELGSRILFATDDWFAAAENLLESSEPVWKEGFTEQVNLREIHREGELKKDSLCK
jgi:allantoicase